MLKSLRIDNDFYKKKYKSLKKKKKIIIFTETLFGSASTKNPSTLSILNPGVGVINLSSTAFLTSMANFVTYEYISKLKIRHTNLGDWVKVISRLYEKTLKTSRID